MFRSWEKKQKKDQNQMHTLWEHFFVHTYLRYLFGFYVLIPEQSAFIKLNLHEIVPRN